MTQIAVMTQIAATTQIDVAATTQIDVMAVMTQIAVIILIADIVTQIVSMTQIAATTQIDVMDEICAGEAYCVLDVRGWFSIPYEIFTDEAGFVPDVCGVCGPG